MDVSETDCNRACYSGKINNGAVLTWSYRSRVKGFNALIANILLDLRLSFVQRESRGYRSIYRRIVSL